ncbi:hypothetical protein [Chakrabartyella piscis]|uniref:YkvI family membrane protein n=1 Tax=Chakrabartyella piscis TaxID=2918914 RepID=UPI0029588598|nr:hypothetical protein [Chakrabartyella piscis]
MSKTNWLKSILIPGIVFQSVVIAGGYGTGAEIVQFFGSSGSVGGLMSMCLISLVTWSILCAITFEFTRTFETYDYKSLTKKLLGPGWVLYEICYLVLLLIVLAVVTASAGDIVLELFGLNRWIGILLMAAGIFALVMNGSALIEKVLSYWSFLLYGVYILFLIFAFVKIGGQISGNFATGTVEPGWVKNGFSYAFYNLGIVPAVLYTVRHCKTRKQAITSGILAGIIGIIPAVLLYVAMVGFSPEVLSEGLPVNYMLSQLNAPWLQYIFQIVLFGTLIETGSGFIFAVSDRWEVAYKTAGKAVPKNTTLICAVVLLVLGVGISQFGLTGLIAKGYGTISWGFFFVYVIPMITLGVYKISKAPKK